MSFADCGVINVEEPFNADDVSINCGGFDVTSSVEVGDEVGVLLEIVNQNPGEVSVDWSLDVNFDTIDSGNRTVPGNDSRDFTVPLVFDEAGDYDVDASITNVNDRS